MTDITVDVVDNNIDIIIPNNESTVIEVGAGGVPGETGSIGLTGPKGDTGPEGPTGVQGPNGYTPIKGVDYFDGGLGPQGDVGPAGPGIAVGGNSGQYLIKKSSTNYDTEWHTVEDNSIAITDSLSTGLVTGGIITIGSDNISFSVLAGAGWIIDSTTNPLFPTKTFLEWNNFIDIPDEYLGISAITYIAIDTNKTIHQSSVLFTQTQLRDYIYLGATGHPGLTVDYGTSYPSLGYNYGKTLEDFLNAFGAFNLTGNVYGPSGSTLQIVKSEGQTFSYGSNYVIDKKSPNVVNDPLLINPYFFYAHRNGLNSWDNTTFTDTIDPNYYDNETGLVAVPSGCFTIQQLYYFPGIDTELTGILYGQATYNTISEAESNIQTSIETNPATDAAIFRGWLVVKVGTTDLSNPAKAKFISAGKLGSTSSGGSSNVTDHALLTNLDYAHAGHTGFVADYITINAKPLTGNINLSQDDISDGSTNRSFTDVEKTKLAGIAAGAGVNVNADWNASVGDATILNKPYIVPAYISSTGLIKGGELSINGSDPTKFDVAELWGVVVDNYTDPILPVVTSVHIGPIIGIVDPYLATDSTSNVAVDSTGSIIVSNTDNFTEEERRDFIVLGWTTHTIGDVIESIFTEPDWCADVFQQFNDFMENFGAFNIAGNEYAVSSGLQIKRSLGKTFDNGTNYSISKKNPNIFSTIAEDPVDIYYYYQTSSGIWKDDSAAVIAIDPNHYDTGSGLAIVPSGNWTIQTISFYAPLDSTDVQYGQVLYPNLVSAQSSLNIPVLIDPYNSFDTFRAWLIVKQGITNLADPLQATFVTAGKLGLISMASGGGSGGEINTASNVGMIGVGLFNEKIGIDLQFKNLEAGTGIILTDNPANKTIIIANNSSGSVSKSFVVAMSVALGG